MAKLQSCVVRNRAAGRRSRGSAIAEMVVIAPLLLLILVGLIEAGRIGDYAIKVGNAARAGVQYGALSLGSAGDAPGMQNAATADGESASITATANEFCKCADGTASTCQPTDCATNHMVVFVQVTATGVFPSIFKNYQALPNSLRNLTITRKAVMRVAQ